MTESNTWRRCNACKEPIALGAVYQVCSVSTCNQKRTGMVFCTVDCWEVHLPSANHREAWAVEKTAPKTAEAPDRPAAAPAKSADRKPRRRIVRPEGASRPPSTARAKDPAEEAILIVASRLKDYVRARSGFNTSDRALGPLSDIVRRAVDEAIERARREERKTVLDRDIPPR